MIVSIHIYRIKANYEGTAVATLFRIGGGMMKNFSIMLALMAITLFVSPSMAQMGGPARKYRPNHVMAYQNRTCPQGYARLFGANPPTCYQECQPGYQVFSNHISGAWCVSCPPGCFVRKEANPNSFSCWRNTGGGTFGQGPNVVVPCYGF
jgi:hypothetical protein